MAEKSLIKDEFRKSALLFALQAFAEKYLGLGNVTVYWAELANGIGQCDPEKKVIYLALNQPLLQEGFSASSGLCYFYRKPLKLKPGEQYFLTLLHEIAHLMLNPKVPKRYLKAKRLLEKDYPNDKEMQAYEAPTYLERKKNESLEDWEGAVEDFRSWLATGLAASQHIAIDKWAVREFRKNRREIREMLKECGY